MASETSVFPLLKKARIVQIPPIGRHPVIVAQILSVRHLFAVQERLIELLAVPRTDNPNLIVRLQKPEQGFRQGADGRRRSLLDKDVARARHAQKRKAPGPPRPRWSS